MSTAAKCVVLDTWAGRRYYAVEVVGETPKKARIRVLTPGGVMLPNRRYVQCGEIALVPKHAIKDMPNREPGKAARREWRIAAQRGVQWRGQAQLARFRWNVGLELRSQTCTTFSNKQESTKAGRIADQQATASRLNGIRFLKRGRLNGCSTNEIRLDGISMTLTPGNWLTVRSPLSSLPNPGALPHSLAQPSEKLPRLLRRRLNPGNKPTA